MGTFYAEREYFRNISAFAIRNLFCTFILEIHNSVISAGRIFYLLVLKDREGSLRASYYHLPAPLPLTLTLCQMTKIAHNCLEIKVVLQVFWMTFHGEKARRGVGEDYLRSEHRRTLRNHDSLGLKTSLTPPCNCTNQEFLGSDKDSQQGRTSLHPLQGLPV